jgi:hypothetical protein
MSEPTGQEAPKRSGHLAEYRSALPMLRALLVVGLRYPFMLTSEPLRVLVSLQLF